MRQLVSRGVFQDTSPRPRGGSPSAPGFLEHPFVSMSVASSHGRRKRTGRSGPIIKNHETCAFQRAHMLYMLCYIGAKYHIVVTRKLNLFLRKSIKLLPPELLLYAPNRLSAGASPQTPLGELTSLPRPPSWVKGAYF